MNDLPKCYVLYDGECPVCAHYIAATGIAEHRPDVTLIDARLRPDLVAQHYAAGRDIDDGMMVVSGSYVAFGADATRKLAEISRSASPSTRLVLWVIGTAPWAQSLYPLLAGGRRLLLRLLGRSLIRDSLRRN